MLTLVQRGARVHTQEGYTFSHHGTQRSDEPCVNRMKGESTKERMSEIVHENHVMNKTLH